MRGFRILLAELRSDVYGSGAFGPHVARAARLLAASGRVALWAVAVGSLGAVLGTGVVSGLLGLLGGLAWGLWRERRRHSSRDAP